MGAKVGQKPILQKIKDFGDFGAHPKGMEIDPEERFYYVQYDLEYQIEGRRDNVKHSNQLKLNLYFDPVRRDQEIIDIDISVKSQQNALAEIKESGTPLDDDETIKKAYRFFILDYDHQTRKLKGYTLDQKKLDHARLTAGFFAISRRGWTSHQSKPTGITICVMSRRSISQ